jgi:hypothetical protein
VRVVAAEIGNDVEQTPGVAYPKCLNALTHRTALT